MPKIFISMQFLNEVLLEALDVFKNFQTSLSSTINLNFLFISIGSYFSKSETVVGQILQSEISSTTKKSSDEPRTGFKSENELESIPRA